MSNRVLVGVLCCLALVATAASAVAAPIQWAGNGHSYELINSNQQPISWDDAEAAAVARGGYLATITSPEEDAWVYQTVVAPNYVPVDRGGPWIGGYWDLPDYHVWKWVTGEPFAYTDWWPGEPDYYAGDNRVAYSSQTSGIPGRWIDNINSGDFPDWHEVGYVIEYNRQNVPEPSTLAIWSLLGGFGIAVGCWRRKRAA